MAPKGGKKSGEKSGGGASDGQARPATAEPTRTAGASAEDIEEDEEQQGNKRDGADVSRVTDYVEEKELDQSRAAEAAVENTP